MKYIVNIEKRSDGSFVAYNVSGRDTIIGTGMTVSEAKEDYFNSIRELKELNAEKGYESSPEIDGTPEFKFDLVSLFNYYDFFNVSKLAKIIGISASLMRQYKLGNTAISEKQLSKIEGGINRLGQELATLRLL